MSLDGQWLIERYRRAEARRLDDHLTAIEVFLQLGVKERHAWANREVFGA